MIELGKPQMQRSRARIQGQAGTIFMPLRARQKVSAVIIADGGSEIGSILHLALHPLCHPRLIVGAGDSA